MKKDMNLVFFGKGHQMTSPSSLDVRITDGKTCTTVTLANDSIPQVASGREPSLDVFAENQKLKEENEILKVKLSRVLAFIKENKM